MDQLNQFLISPIMRFQEICGTSKLLKRGGLNIAPHLNGKYILIRENFSLDNNNIGS
jgi:hypothetical protein